MSLLDDYKEIVRIAEENESLKIKLHKINKVINESCNVELDMRTINGTIRTYDYLRIGKKVVEIMDNE